MAIGLHADAVRVLTGWTGPGAGQESLREAYLDFLAGQPDGLLRQCVPRHLTASALVVDATHRRALLTLHRKGGFWAQTGGHCEPGDTTLAGAALREAVEESGITGLRLLPGPVDLDLHELSGSFGACRAHLDVRYVAIAPSGSQPVISAESHQLRWFDLGGLTDPQPAEPVGGGRPADLRRLARATVTALR